MRSEELTGNNKFLLQHVGEVRTQLFKTPRAYERRDRRKCPKIQRLMLVLPKPFVRNKTLPVAFNKVVGGI